MYYLISITGPHIRRMTVRLADGHKGGGSDLSFWKVVYAIYSHGTTTVRSSDFMSESEAKDFAAGMQLYPLVSITPEGNHAG